MSDSPQPVRIERCFKRSTIRTATAHGHIVTSGGAWEVTMTDGRMFVHKSKATARKAAAVYAAGGEAALAAWATR